MSRIGKKPVSIPSGVKVNHDPRTRTVGIEGPKGKMSFVYHPVVGVAWNDAAKEVVCTIPDAKMEDGPTRALWGTTRARIQGMVDGVTRGFVEKLELVGVGWSIKAVGNKVQMSVGFCNPVEVLIPTGIDVKIEKETITISGHDRQAVGQLAAEIRSKRKPEPYNGKGVKYANEAIIRKQGKAFGTG